MALTDNLIAYWKFEQSSGNATDSVGSFTLTNINTATYSGAKINSGGNLGTSNTNKYFRNDPIASDNFPLTVSGWFNASIVNDDGNIFSLLDVSGNIHYYQLKLRSSDSHIVFRSNNNTQAADVDTGITASTNTWYHYSVTIINTTRVTIYINGVLTNDTAAIFVASGLDRLAFGALARTVALQFASLIMDEIGVWTRLLTQTEVSTLYNGGNGLTYPFVYPFNLLGVGI